MITIERTFASAAENVAYEQVLLEQAESDQNDFEVLRFWEPSSHFIVIGRAGVVDDDLWLERCNRDRVTVVRRISGGGTILTGPGCLMYSVVLCLRSRPALRDISLAHRFVCEKIQAAYSDCGMNVELRGHSDLCIGDKKFSGNALRIGRTHALYHGTLLVDFDLSLIPKYLKLPPRRPEYRISREHLDFVTNATVSVTQLKAKIQNRFGARHGDKKDESETLEHLVAQRYSKSEWNLKR